MRYVVTFFWLTILVLAVAFVISNSYTVSLNYYFGHIKIYIPFLLFLVLVLGILLGICVMLPVWLRAKYGRRKLKNRLRDAEQELKNLRNIPIQDTH